MKKINENLVEAIMKVIEQGIHPNFSFKEISGIQRALYTLDEIKPTNKKKKEKK
jgi:hypothetical protein